MSTNVSLTRGLSHVSVEWSAKARYRDNYNNYDISSALYTVHVHTFLITTSKRAKLNNIEISLINVHNIIRQPYGMQAATYNAILRTRETTTVKETTIN